MNDLTTIDGIELAELANILGTETSSGGGDTLVRVPKLDHQHAADDDDGNPMPRGEFRLHMPDQIVYAKTVRFRPLASHVQYFLWENDKLVKSRALKNMREEARDTAGGIACGMPEWEVRAENEDLRQKYKDCQRRIVRGLVSMTGHNIEGDEIIIENQPTIYFGKGRTNYGGFFNEYIKQLPKGSNIFDYEANMSTERMKVGATVFFKIHWEPLLKNKLPMTQDVFETMKVFADSITAENKYVDDQYFKAHAEDSLDSKAMAAIEDSLEADLADA
ncbi:hypothetical protein CRP235_gp12 [Roseobacter phage CRP-235]|nr:hypothetical protein CRP235_gp12 [Roseobacter phage CRP-235]